MSTGQSELGERPVARVILKRGREKPVVNRHPWVFSGAVDHVEGDQPQAGDLVTICAGDGSRLALAYYNPASQIRARILSWKPSQQIGPGFWRQRLSDAIQRRTALRLAQVSDAYRLVYGESDGIPGLIVDKYGPFLVAQFLTAGTDSRKEMILDTLDDLLRPAGIIERSDMDVRKKEGLIEMAGLARGNVPPPEFEIRENGLAFRVDLFTGHKTGFYLDQRENRVLVCQDRHVRDAQVLNAFAYTGAFAVYAASAGAASVVNVETSAGLLEEAKANVHLNGLSRPSDEYIVGDAFQVLRHFRDTGRQFDVIILDPPKFAYRQRDVEAACRGYKDLNWLALRIVRPNGLLATFSCSGLVGAELFQKVVFSAAIDAGRDAQILYRLDQAPDHPVLLTFPEAAYLKGFLCRVI
ncbi:MAG: class I SAM-dependent rRNA methyltransferase [Candidatus Promineifilaceae bacterium]